MGQYMTSVPELAISSGAVGHTHKRPFGGPELVNSMGCSGNLPEPRQLRCTRNARIRYRGDLILGLPNIIVNILPEGSTIVAIEPNSIDYFCGRKYDYNDD
jgi:hypothetical protein